MLLIANPFVISVGQVAMRRMKEMKQAIVVTTYMNLMLLAIMVPLVYLTG